MIASSKLVFGLCLLGTVVHSAYGQACRTPDRKDGQCISLYECSSILSLVQGKVLTPRERQFLQASQCTNGAGRFPHVCCGRGAVPSIPNVAQPVTRQPNPSSGINFLLPDPNKNDCGVSIGMRIYGGKNADIDEFPWLALLEYRNKKGKKSFSCGGTLINSRYIVTAAHCVVGEIEEVVGSLVNVRFGEHNTDTDVDCVQGDYENICADPPQNIGIEQIIPHPNYSARDRHNLNDIALVRLASTVRFSDFVQPICLPTSSFRDSNTDDVDFVAGFGRTLTASRSSIKQKLSIKIYDHNKCVQKFAEKQVTVTKSQICAGGFFAQDSCQGDSGGPLMRLRQVWTLEGVVSYGNKCGLEGWPGIYTKVATYMDWIKGNLRA